MGANESRPHHKTTGDQKRTQNGTDIVRTAHHQQVTDAEAEQVISSLEKVIDQSDMAENSEDETIYDNNPLTMNQPIIDDDTLPNTTTNRDTYAQPIKKQQREAPSALPNKKGNNINNTPPPKPQRANNSNHSNREQEQAELDIRFNPSPRNSEHSITTPNLDSPAHNNMNTIKQAKVNVRDRINLFKTGDPERQLPIQIKSTVGRPKTHIETSSQPLLPPKPSIGTRIKSDHQYRHEHQEQTTPSRLLAELDGENIENREEGSRHAAVGRKLSADNRMNTLDVFNRIKKDHEVLNKFEKAKPAAKRNKRRPQTRISMVPDLEIDHHNHLPRTEFSGPFGSDPELADTKRSSDEIVDQMLQENDEKREILATINNKTGQKYAMDDTIYETLRRKKIAGQRPAIGVMDKTTEKNFLLSLKRNFQFKRHVQLDDIDTQDETTPRGHYLSDMVF